MGKYTDSMEGIFAVFAAQAWKDENIKTYPSNFIPVTPGKEFIKVAIIPSGPGVNLRSLSGVFIVDIYTPAGTGIKTAASIADKLDDYLETKTLSVKGSTIQFGNSAMSFTGVDRDNKSLFRSKYQITFNFYGV